MNLRPAYNRFALVEMRAIEVGSIGKINARYRLHSTECKKALQPSHF